MHTQDGLMVRRGGRPRVYSEELAESICDRLAQGDPIREICQEDGFPSWSTVRSWLLKNGEFSTRYARAREMYAEIRNDDMRTKIQRCPTNRNEIEKLRLELDHMKWELSKLSPKKYGDKVGIEAEVNHNFIPLPELLKKAQAIELRENSRVGGPAGEAGREAIEGSGLWVERGDDPTRKRLLGDRGEA